MKRLIPLLLLILFFSRCAPLPGYESSSYYSEYYNPNGYLVYPDDKAASAPVLLIPAGNTVHSRSNPHGRYLKIQYGDHEGYVINKGFRKKKTGYVTIPYHIHQQQEQLYASCKRNFARFPDRDTEGINSSISGTGSVTARPTNTAGSVHVSGYHRKDGTYVRPHTRSGSSRH
jgi:hypothetical protein